MADVLRSASLYSHRLSNPLLSSSPASVNSVVPNLKSCERVLSVASWSIGDVSPLAFRPRKHVASLKV